MTPPTFVTPAIVDIPAMPVVPTIPGVTIFVVRVMPVFVNVLAPMLLAIPLRRVGWRIPLPRNPTRDARGIPPMTVDGAAYI